MRWERPVEVHRAVASRFSIGASAVEACHQTV
jgi:hypothetical protein